MINSYTVEDEPVKSWDEYYYNVARQVARNSKCFSRRIGAVLVKDKVIIGAGYNGPSRGIPTCDQRWRISVDPNFIFDVGISKINENEIKGKCPRKVLGYKSGEKLDICVAVHAEVNAIVSASRLGICTKNAQLFLTCPVPCFRCLSVIINAGVEEVIVPDLEYYDNTSKFLLNNSNLKIRLYEFLK